MLTAKRQHIAAVSASDVDEEVSKCLADNSGDSPFLQAYPCSRKLCISSNASLPSSAAAKRLFSLGRSVFLPLRSWLSSDDFERTTFLRAVNW